jgi:uncharacterized protein YkwD
VGAPALTLCPALARTADSYAQTIARTGHFDHTGPDGSSPWDRMQANGYRGYSLAAENIAAGQRSVDAVMTAWLNSPGHAANIRNPALRQFGAGRATSSGRYGIYWVQEFGTGGTCA